MGFTVGSVGFKRYLVSIIVTHCGISRSTSQPPLVEDLLFFQKSPSSVSRIFSARHSSHAQLVAQERLCHFSLPPPFPATREQTKALLQSALAAHLDLSWQLRRHCSVRQACSNRTKSYSRKALLQSMLRLHLALLHSMLRLHLRRIPLLPRMMSLICH